MPRLALIVLFILAACSPAAPTVTPESVLDAFRSAGLEAVAIDTPRDASLPVGCTMTRLSVPSAQTGGRVVVCASPVDVERVAGYPRTGGKSSTFPADWVFVKGSAVVVLDGATPENVAKRYEAAMP